MEGHARIETFDHLALDPETAPILAEMRDEDGNPTVCEDVWISYYNGKERGEEDGHGPLTAGYGSRRDALVDGGKIGPEFTFGIYAQKAIAGPVLIIKTAWGGKSIHTDFRSPSAGPYVFSEQQLYKAEIFTPEELGILQLGTSNAAYHYLGSAKIMAQIGKAFAEALVQ